RARKKRRQQTQCHRIDRDRDQHGRNHSTQQCAFRPIDVIEPPGEQAEYHSGRRKRPCDQPEIAAEHDEGNQHSNRKSGGKTEPLGWGGAPASATLTGGGNWGCPRSKSRPPDRAAANSAAAWSPPPRTRARTAQARQEEIARRARDAIARSSAPPAPRAPSR